MLAFVQECGHGVAEMVQESSSRVLADDFGQ